MALAGGLVFFGGVLGGCAKVPADENRVRSKILAITMTLRGAVNIAKPTNGGNFYFFLINRTDNFNDPGPVAVIAPPWGNGFAAPAQDGAQGFIGFVEYSRRTQSSLGGYKLYEVQKDNNGNLLNPTLNQFKDDGSPDRTTAPNGGSTLAFEVDLGRLPLSTTQFILVNMIATDTLPAGAQDTPKRWDALGSGRDASSRNYVIRIDARQNQTIRNFDIIGTDQEVEGDVLDRLIQPPVDDSSLDIIDWTVTIRDS